MPDVECLTVKTFIELLEDLKKRGLVTDDTKIYVQNYERRYIPLYDVRVAEYTDHILIEWM
jgi:hypothetical protein